jgi:hypothetical protein
MRAPAAVALVLLAGCWNFDGLARLYQGVDAGPPPPSDLSAPCVAGAPCVTGKPGVCSPGHLHCDSGTVCVADTAPTTESCFNNLDDDCDGAINNGCPDHLELGTEHTLTQHGGEGGSARPVRCPANSFVVSAGFWGNDPNSSATGVELTCASFTLVKGTSSYSLGKNLFSGTVLVQASEGNQNRKGYNSNADCSSGLLASTWFTSNVSYDPLTTNPTYVVSGFGSHCASSSIGLSAMNQLDITFSRQGSADDEICYTTAMSAMCLGQTIEDDCGPHEVLIGFDLHMGSLMDSIAAVCAPVVTIYK